jgi:hypothetical protein
MAENALLNVIRDIYTTKYPDMPADAIAHFCEFANEWLRKKGVVGVGQTVEGFAIRFTDGSEHVLVASAPTEITPGTPVSITGLASRNQRVVPDSTRSVPITGN